MDANVPPVSRPPVRQEHPVGRRFPESVGKAPYGNSRVIPGGSFFLHTLAQKLLVALAMANVLVIDDDSHFRGIIERIILRSYTYSVKSVANEEEAREELSKDSYDLVLLDLYIDGKKSWDILKRIKAMPSAPAVIMISCENLAENAEHAKVLGAADFVPKPLDFAQLKVSVDAALDWMEKSRPSRG